MKSYLTAIRLRLVFLCVMLLIIVVSVAVFQFAYGILKTTAQDVSAKAAEAVASQNEVDRLKRVEQQLAQNQQAVNRVADIVAESKSYQYQNQIVHDLNDFAQRSGVKITSIDFTQAAEGSAASGGASATPSPAPAAPAAPGSADMPGAPAVPATPAVSLKAVSATITLASPIDYNSFLRFINAIEQNLTKMQIQKLGLTASEEGVSSDSLTIQVYTR